MKKILYMIISMVALSSCHVYRSYERPSELPTEGLFEYNDTVSVSDTTSIGDLPWEEMFQDTLLQSLIRTGIENNTDLQIAVLRVDQAMAKLKAARLSFLPSLNLSPQASLNSNIGNNTTKTYQLPVMAEWEIDLFGKLRNAKKATQADLLQQKAYQQVVKSELIASIANNYYSLMMLDEQMRISLATIEIWKEQLRVMEAKFKVGEEKENAISQARANLHELNVTNNDLQRQIKETEFSLCTLLGTTYRHIQRSSIEQQVFPDYTKIGLPIRLLSRRPDVVQAEMSLASAYYTTNQARAAFYPSLTLSGSLGWTNALGQMVSNPGNWILSAVASLTQPIFNKGKLVSNLRVSKDEEQIALLTFKQTILEAGEEVNNNLYAADIAKSNLENRINQCNELNNAVQMSETLYKNGEATYLDLLTARQSLLNAQLNLVSDRFTYCQSIINLYNALGGGAE